MAIDFGSERALTVLSKDEEFGFRNVKPESDEQKLRRKYLALKSSLEDELESVEEELKDLEEQKETLETNLASVRIFLDLLNTMITLDE